MTRRALAGVLIAIVVAVSGLFVAAPSAQADCCCIYASNSRLGISKRICYL